MLMRIRTSAMFVALWLAFAGVASAQVSNTGTITDRRDRQGRRPPARRHRDRQRAGHHHQAHGVTDAQGVATLEALAPSAQYTSRSQLQGFQDQTRDADPASARARPRRSPFTLPVAGVTEAVQVTAATPLVDVTSATTGQDITLQLTESLPTGRSYQSYLQLVPGVHARRPEQLAATRRRARA